jgi:hypothetical protein
MADNEKKREGGKGKKKKKERKEDKQTEKLPGLPRGKSKEGMSNSSLGCTN